MGNFPICCATSAVITYFLIIDCDMEIPYSFKVCVNFDEIIVAFAPARFCFSFVECLLYFCFIMFTLYCFGLVISS